MKIKINNHELDLSEEEIEEFIARLNAQGYWISNITFDFGNQEFTEKVQLVGNSVYWGQLPDQQFHPADFQ